MPRWEDARPILVTAYDLMEQSDMATTSGPEIARTVLGRSDDDPRFGTTLRALHDDGFASAGAFMAPWRGAASRGPPPSAGTSAGPREPGRLDERGQPATRPATKEAVAFG
jgi:hypothetical protein